MVEGLFKSVYETSADLINVVSEDLMLFCKFLRTLDLKNQGVFRRMGSFVLPAVEANILN